MRKVIKKGGGNKYVLFIVKPGLEDKREGEDEQGNNERGREI